MASFAGIIPFLLSLSACLSLFSVGALAQEKPIPEMFQDWGKICETPEGSSEKVCFAFQNVSVNDSNKVLLSLNVHFLAGQDKPAMVVSLPMGVALVPGVLLQVDEGEPMRIPYNVCLNSSCRAGFAIDDKLMATLKGGSKLNVVFTSLQGKANKLTTSLSGFTAAVKAINP